MDAESACYEFHLRMTVATTEHEKFESLVATLVPTPTTVVSPANLEAINDARNILSEAIASVCEAYEQLDDVDGEINPDEERIIDEACDMARLWHEEIDQVMVQLRQIVWDSQHGYIRRLISGARTRSEKKAGKAVDDVPFEVPAPVASIREAVEEPEPEYDDEGEDEEDQETETVRVSEDVPQASFEDVPQEPATEEPDTEDAVEEPEESGQPLPTTSTDDPEKTRAEIEAEVRKEIEAEVRKEVEAKIRAEMEEQKTDLMADGYKQGVNDLAQQLLAAQKANEVADQAAAESTPLARKSKAPAKKTTAKKGHRILGKKKEATE